MLDLIIDALACARITRLVTTDTITRPLRARVIRGAYNWQQGSRFSTDDMTEAEWDDQPRTDDDAPKLAAFVVCPWCVGLWVALGVVAARKILPTAWSALARALALSAVTGILATHAE